VRTVTEWKSILRERLKEAMLGRDHAVVSMYRETLAAIDNAEAPAVERGPAAAKGAIAGALVGLRAGDAPRIALAPKDVRLIVERELGERREAAAAYETHGKPDEAERLRRQADILQSLIG
jgi:uncharacterized protein YqeY